MISLRTGVVVVVLTVIAPVASAELRRVGLEVLGMDCGVCAHAVVVTLRKLEGVDRVDVSLTGGAATVMLRQGNRITLEQIARVVRRNGFDAKKATVAVVGTLQVAEGRLLMEIGHGIALKVVPDAARPELYQRLVSQFLLTGSLGGELVGTVEFAGGKPGAVTVGAFTPF